MIISISGTDGSGKSSACAGLVQKLVKNNSKAKKFVLGDYFILGYFLGLVKYIAKDRSAETSRTSNPFLSTGQKPTLYSLLLIPVLLDNFLNFLRLKLFSALGYAVVCDRYFYDRLVGLAYYGYIPQSLFAFYLALTPRPDVAILLDLSAELCLTREQKEKHSLEFYDSLRELFRKLHHKYDLVLNTDTLTKAETVTKIFDVVYKVA